MIDLPKKLQRYSFWVVLLCHLLLLLFFSIVWVSPIQVPPLPDEKHPSLDISSYLYQGALTEPAPALSKQQPEKRMPRDSLGINQFRPPPQPQTSPMSNQMTSHSQEMTTAQSAQAVHLIGDKNVAVKPLIKLLGIALTAHLVYPRIAIDFNVKGTAMVGFTIHPNGEVTDVKLMKSSGAKVLDQSALAGVIAMSPVMRVGPYVQAPKFLVIGIVFR